MEVSRTLSQGRVIRMEYSWEQNTKQWWDDKAVCEFSAFPVLYVFTIWEARNRAIFKNTWTPINITSALLLQKFQEHRTIPKAGKCRAAIAPVIDRSTPWAFFDGASQGEPAISGASGVIYISE